MGSKSLYIYVFDSRLDFFHLEVFEDYEKKQKHIAHKEKWYNASYTEPMIACFYFYW